MSAAIPDRVASGAAVDLVAPCAAADQTIAGIALTLSGSLT